MLDWVVAGAETGPEARLMNEAWVKSLRDECVQAAIPFWYKQNVVDGVRVRNPRLDGKAWNQMPPLPSLVTGVRPQKRFESQKSVTQQMNLFD
jgi:protein gp37